MSTDSIRAKKKLFWDAGKDHYHHWLAANMSSEEHRSKLWGFLSFFHEAFLGFTTINARKITGKDTIHFTKFYKLNAEGRLVKEDFFSEVLAKPKE
jgi:hypothetical protein